MNNYLMNDLLVIKALEFATQGHAAVGQLRKYTKDPYIVHPLAVMQILLDHSSYPVTVEMLAAAACHDLVEDTSVTLDDVRNYLGDQVAVLVDWLTDISKPHHGNRKVRKAIDNEHTAQAPISAQNIKLADIIHNAIDISDHDPKFAKVWLNEKKNLMEMLPNSDPSLFAIANKTINECLIKIST
jgi:(p)ppGpp synthase/HD superfamily hydrolase